MITDTLPASSSLSASSAAGRPLTVRVAAHDAGSAAAWGARAVRYSLIVVFLWFGALKFTDFEASGIAPLILNSPLVMWLGGALGIGGAAHVIGVYELLTALLIAAHRWQPRLCAIGGAMAVLCFLVTLSFLFSTPGVVQAGFSVPLALSPMPGQFLLKDLVLLCASFWVAAASLEEARAGR